MAAVDTSSAAPILKVPPINAYGTFERSRQMSPRPNSERSPSQGSNLSNNSQSRPLLPSNQKPSGGIRVAKDLIPFASVYTSLTKKLQLLSKKDPLPEVAVRVVSQFGWHLAHLFNSRIRTPLNLSVESGNCPWISI